ncbi:hypothetical protein ACT4Z0_18350 [Acinetobacter baumannii]|uniref:hypothetical protein n=1 Tax=Acinetobacter calcoaceticus/baumannii complex TaxID=909768 RepID=UPI00083FC692|nr:MULTISPECIES: hypothetical protein [Acinetobacter calcoaceticus/baumannii complex]KAB1609466.1 hypothetical protein F8B12_14815 [Acinetobacter baumannii]MBP4063937.1 hypothetical protein [Acinetobacter baumannii]MDH2548321.1 hypothetical protein [Acinetobacter baumannii]MDH2642441.1 hypothetical protein [Acinetobacter baumannii]MDH2650489.1 hypothetical protein [Acinetobacter baumannii]
MKFIDHTTPPNDPKFHNDADETTTYTYQVINASNIRSPADKLSTREKLIKAGHWKTLKPWLASKSGEKCWFCEAKQVRSPSDVEHFRPKNEVHIHRKVLNYPLSHANAGQKFEGYWWLSYNWKNFRLSCQRCNREEKDSTTKIKYGKGNEFPLIDENSRCWDHSSNIHTEQPLLLDPCIQSDTELLLHPLSGEITPTNTDRTTVEYKRADFTINLLGLNAHGVKDIKLELRHSLETILELNIGNDNVHCKVDQEISNKLNPDTEYYTFIKGIILQYRDEIPWLESKLSSMGL